MENEIEIFPRGKKSKAGIIYECPLNGALFEIHENTYDKYPNKMTLIRKP